VTEYVERKKEDAAGLKLQRYNFVAPLEEEGAPITFAPDAKVAAR
jgi:2,3-bisphosphoglycerate-dependent phosphoglycerate mutase